MDLRPMFTEITAIARRSSATLLQDLAGGCALTLLLLAGLYLPAML